MKAVILVCSVMMVSNFAQAATQQPKPIKIGCHTPVGKKHFYSIGSFLVKGSGQKFQGKLIFQKVTLVNKGSNTRNLMETAVVATTLSKEKIGIMDTDAKGEKVQLAIARDEKKSAYVGRVKSKSLGISLPVECEVNQ